MIDSHNVLADGNILEIVADPSSAIAMAISTRPGDEAKVSIYFQDTLIREFFVARAFCAKLSAALTKISQHDK